MSGKTGRGRIDGKLGYYIKLFSKMERGEAKFTKKKMQFLIPLIKESRNKIIVAICIAIFSSIFNLFPVMIQKIIIDDAILKNNETGLILFSILLITVFITQWFITYIRTRTFRFVSQRIIFNLRTVVFNRIMSLSLKDTNETKKGELLSVVMNDVNLLSTSVASGIISLFADVISVIGIV
ncbi:MAG TPA: ABC transporter ATP-binding protein, partial [archaeon]|nr:ABC transporter ATP-binding protein [archaeon]